MLFYNNVIPGADVAITYYRKGDGGEIAANRFIDDESGCCAVVHSNVWIVYLQRLRT